MSFAEALAACGRGDAPGDAPDSSWLTTASTFYIYCKHLEEDAIWHQHEDARHSYAVPQAPLAAAKRGADLGACHDERPHTAADRRNSHSSSMDVDTADTNPKPSAQHHEYRPPHLHHQSSTYSEQPVVSKRPRPGPVISPQPPTDEHLDDPTEPFCQRRGLGLSLPQRVPHLFDEHSTRPGDVGSPLTDDAVVTAAQGQAYGIARNLHLC
ncbi:uncharacterized protein MONBRDRAFT_37012 [Monosiga brevicollis MX1]|uniref:Uncharacterized protein n=1 Tax=Monosiga brevicollis TaxID=81824 RepID=A9UZ13_MONBE|nr:uncharacterized protein MONBRDRAFT_37012 [Monosiga brevicollis MX1]EDQ89704.1 predicted protein [Monosiga brevicollis MX1]|eukprot:XP_001745733.1 hypothetical protein [Monosiga brevicollis MX1]